ncbi:outer membrane receptor for ferric coprogen and ferric-rhodotorulic acid [Parvibaculum indicum]|uniref:TonB-dependent siderophore receptor n=1 Tax=Parvibaculum indicum TaxID=562969 RepID=UPI001423B864|nr:TonB-dependent siderophore receptor [Parvibaculum indicum]NIJ42989.1 outer membrane receptor for ferric coprogen and ferric-rhodotorulic acid [Parvibaculum indicum]
MFESFDDKGRRARLMCHAAPGALVLALGLAFAGPAQAQDAATAEAGAAEEVTAPIVIEGEGAPETTEGTNSFTSSVATVGGKTPASVREIPQAVSVVTRERMDELNMTQLEDAARRTTGMLVLTNDPGRSSIFTRGFELDTLTVEGLPAPLSSIYGTQPDLAIADRVEFLRGPAGLFTGAGEISGIANLGLKKAHKDFAVKGKASAGSWNNYRVEGDVNAPLVESGALRARLVAAYQDRDSFIDVDENQVGVVYGTLGADLGPKTKLDLFVWHQQRDSVPFNGLPVDTNGNLLDIDRSTFVGASWNNFENEIFESVAKFSHEFDNGFKLNLSARYSDRDVELAYAYGRTAINPPTTTTTSMAGLARKYDEETFSTDANVVMPFQAFGQLQEFVVGVDYRHYEQTVEEWRGAVPYSYDVYNPNPYAVPKPAMPYGNPARSEPTQTGIYAQGRIRPMAGLTLVLGARETWYENETTDTVTGVVSERKDIDGEFTPFAGVSYDLTQNISLFASYAEIFQPQSQITTPVTGENYEAGVKFDGMMGGDFNGALSVFRLNQTDRVVQNPSSPGVYYAGGEVKSEGFEAEISGNLTEKLDLFAGYAFTVTEYVDDPSVPSGTTFSTYTPKHNANLWLRYSFGPDDGVLNGLYIAGGGRAVSDFYNGVIEGPGYATLDAQLGYKVTENVKATFSVNNLLDRKYYERVGGPGLFNFYGAPRNVMFTLEADF